MKIYLLSPNGVPMNQVLFPTFIKTFEEKGHSIVGNIEDCDCIFLDLHTRISDYEQSDVNYLLGSGKAIATWDEWDRGNMSTDVWPHPLTEQQLQIFNHIQNNNIKSVHFCRLMDKTKKGYPPNLYPFEKPIIYQEEICSPENLFNRPYDLFFVANSSPNREKLKKIFEENGGFKCNIVLGQPKIPFQEWINQCKQSKLFIKASAGGYSCERMQALFSISAMAIEKTDQLLLNPFTHLENCISFGQPPTKQDLDTIFEVVNDKTKLYSIYKAGCDFVKKYYTEQYFAIYFLSILKQEGIC